MPDTEYTYTSDEDNAPQSVRESTQKQVLLKTYRSSIPEMQRMSTPSVSESSLSVPDIRSNFSNFLRQPTTSVLRRAQAASKTDAQKARHKPRSLHFLPVSPRRKHVPECRVKFDTSISPQHAEAGDEVQRATQRDLMDPRTLGLVQFSKQLDQSISTVPGLPDDSQISTWRLTLSPFLTHSHGAR